MEVIRGDKILIESINKLLTAQEVNGYEVVRQPYYPYCWEVNADERLEGVFHTLWGAKRYAKKLPYYKNKYKISVEENEQTVAEKLLELYQECHMGLIGHYIKIEPSLFDQDTIIRVLPKYEKIPRIVPISNSNEITHIEWDSNNMMYFLKLYVMRENYDLLIDTCSQLFKNTEIELTDEYKRSVKR